MSADEIRVGCRCETCLKDPDVAGVRIGKDYRAQYDAIREVCPDADIYMWPDMANINHNATDKYYLMQTTTKGALDFIPTDVTMVSWWGTKAPINLPYYTARGYRTMGAGYYDVQDVGEIRKAAEGWRTHLDETPNARGYMYATWLYGVSANFAFLEDFADVWTTVKPYEPTVPGSLPKKIMSFNVRAGYGDTPRYGDFEGVRFAAPAWAVAGFDTLADAEFPPPGSRLVAGRTAYHLRYGPHDLTFEDWIRYIDFAAEQFVEWEN